MLEALFTVVMVLNALWCSAAFRYFSIKADSAAKILVPRQHRDSPLFETVVVGMRFLGGMNLSLAVLAIAVLVFPEAFSDPGQKALICVVFAVAHASQFAFNLPIALKERKNMPTPWPVLSGPMRFIFTVDGLLALANGFFVFMAVLQ